MKKKIIYIFLPLLMVMICFSCKNVLNVAPQNIIQDNVVFTNESAVEAYLASMYNDLPVEDFNFSARNGFNAWASSTFLCHLSDEAICCLTDNKNSIGDGTWLNWWNYKAVRNVNNFIAKIQTAKFSKNKIDEWLGEAKFIRAYYYFGLAKRYGGVPIITQVQNFTGNNLDSLQVPRNTEKEVYDFILSELDQAALLLGETSNPGKANKYVAYALESRAMLYAASDAEYGSVGSNGLTGIPAADAQTYWQAAFNAAKQIINSNKYSLYNKQADKTLNFEDLFLDQNNPEAIFVKYFHYPDKTHSYDLWALPYGVRSSVGYGSRIDPTLELAESFEYTDGSTGTLKITDNQGNPLEYKNPSDLFKNKDPRFAATVISPFDQWRGNTIDVRAGIIDNGQTITAGDYSILYKGMHVIGLNGIGGGGGEVSQTGFYVRKYLNPAYDPSVVSPWHEDQQYIDMRYGEVLLNYAEAAIELGDEPAAKWAVNQVRERAGISDLGDSQVTRDRIRHERMIELAFENHRYWDIRRWHIADQLLNNTKFTAIEPFYVMQDSAYIFKTAQVGFPKTFYPQLYYERIDPGEITRNPDLVQNPGY